MISPNQLLTLKGKLVHLQELQDVNVQGRVLKKVSGVLIDPYGSTKITLWEGDIDKVEEGGTYKFKNLRLKKSKFNQELFVNPAKEDSAITKCAAFEKPLVVPENVPEEFTTTSIVGEVLGVSDIRLDYCRVKCNRCVKIQKIVACDNNKCKLIQKLERCNKQWFLKA